MLIKISDDNFEENVLNASYPFALLFSSPWCRTCNIVKQRMESISNKYNKMSFGIIDISTNAMKPLEFHVLSIPSIIVFKDGEEKERVTGDVTEKELNRKIEKIL